MHILIISWLDIKNPSSGGAELLTHEIAKRLVRWGEEVTLIAPRFPTACRSETVDGVKTLRPTYFYPTSFTTYLRWPTFLASVVKTYRVLQDQIDVVIDQVHGLPSLTALYVDKPVILFPHEVAQEIWFAQVPFPGNVIGWVTERAYLRLFRGFPFIANSPSTERDLKRFGIQRVKTITQGTAEPPKTLPPKTKHPHFILLGRVTQMKRLGDAISAFAILKQYHPESKLTIVGKGSKGYGEELKRKTQALGLKESVSFTGFVSEPEKFKLLAQSWALLSTSLREGWGLVISEAASVGTPTVAYAVPGVVDAVLDTTTGLLTSTNNPSELAKKMRQLVEERDLRTRLSRQAKVHARKFSWDVSAKQFLAAIESYLNEAPMKP